MRALTLGLLRNCSGLKGLPYLNTEDFENFAESPAIVGFATEEGLRKVEDFLAAASFSPRFPHFSAKPPQPLRPGFTSFPLFPQNPQPPQPG